MNGFHKREISKLEEEILNLKNDHEEWLKRQDRENQEWNQERADFKNKISQLQGQLQESKNKNKSL